MFLNVKINGLGFKLTFYITEFVLTEMARICILKLQSVEHFDQIVASKNLAWFKACKNPQFDTILKLLSKT